MNSVQTLELPILDYQDLPPQELFERIVVAKKALGDQVLMLGHNYQRDDVIVHANLRGDSLLLSKFRFASSSAPRKGGASVDGHYLYVIQR